MKTPTAQNIRDMVNAGVIVHWSNAGYTVIRDGIGQYLIEFYSGDCIGLTHQDGETLNGLATSFFIEPKTYHETLARKFARYGFVSTPLEADETAALCAAWVSLDDAYAVGCDVAAGVPFDEAMAANTGERENDCECGGRDAAYRDAAKDEWCDDWIEVDDNAAVSVAEGGAWVAAWVWIDADQVKGE